MNGWLSATAPAARESTLKGYLDFGAALFQVKVGDGSTVHSQRKDRNYSRSHYVSPRATASPMRDGKPYANSYAWSLQMKDGRIVRAQDDALRKFRRFFSTSKRRGQGSGSRAGQVTPTPEPPKLSRYRDVSLSGCVLFVQSALSDICDISERSFRSGKCREILSYVKHLSRVRQLIA
jgi:hypothetical protein